MNPISKDILEKMKGRTDFPSLASTISLLLDELRKVSSSTSSAELNRLISTDPALTKKVLRLCNSPMYAQFGGQVASVEEAVRILGTQAINYLALNVSVLNSFTDDKEAEDSNAKLSLSIMAANMAHDIDVGDDPPSIRPLNVTIANFARLSVAFFLPERWAKVEEEMAKGQDQDLAFLGVLGCPLGDVARDILSSWRFPESLISVATGEDQRPYVDFFNAASEELTQEVPNMEALIDRFPALVTPTIRRQVLDSLAVEQQKFMGEDTLRAIFDNRRKKFSVASALEGIDGSRESLATSLPKLMKCLLTFGPDRVVVASRNILGPDKFRILYFYDKDSGMESVLPEDRRGFLLEEVPMISICLAKQMDVNVRDVQALKAGSNVASARLDLFPSYMRSLCLLPLEFPNRSQSVVYLAWRGPNALDTKAMNEILNFKAAVINAVSSYEGPVLADA